MRLEDQKFNTYKDWVNFASSVLTSHAKYSPVMFRAICFDALGRLCTHGFDFMRAHNEDAFPVRWIWPDQVATIEAARHAVEPSATAQLAAKLILRALTVEAFENDADAEKALFEHEAGVARLLSHLNAVPSDKSTLIEPKPLEWRFFKLPGLGGAVGVWDANLPWGSTVSIEAMTPDLDAPHLVWRCAYLSQSFASVDEAKAAVAERVASHLRHGINRSLTTETVLYEIQAKLRTRGEDTDVSLQMSENGNTAEFAAEACRPTRAVRLGEVDGEYHAARGSFDEALLALLDAVSK